MLLFSLLSVRNWRITAREDCLRFSFLFVHLQGYDTPPANSQETAASEDLVGSGGKLLAVLGMKNQGGSVVLASSRKEILNFLSSQTCCSAYFGVSYDTICVAKLQLIFLCLGFLLSTGSPSLLGLFLYH